MAAFRDDPSGFVRFAFDWGVGDLADMAGPDRWQAAVLDAIGASLARGEAPRIAVSSGHGVGKTALVAWIVLWFLATRADPQVVVTANTTRQLATKTWRELAKWRRLCLVGADFAMTADRLARRGAERTWFAAAVPWSRERPEAFAGTHERHVLVVYDEASAIDDAVWEVTEGAMTTPGAMWMVFGNPTRVEGRFADCFGRQAHRWRTFRVDARDAVRADSDQIGRWIADYGEDSDFVRVRVRGEFPRVSAERFVGADLLALARTRAVRDGRPGAAVLGVDVARFGDDDSVALLRIGGVVARVQRWRRLDTMQLAASVAELILAWRPRQVFVDGVGVGGGVVDRLRQLGHRVVDVGAGGRAADERRFANLRAEMWSRMRDWLQEGGVLPAADEALAREIGAPGYAFDARGRLRIESKDDLRARGEGSPDAADALALTFAYPVRDHGVGDDPYLFPRQTRTDSAYRILP
ncbi:MAG: terminase [Rhodospirillales bacterium]|nr:MAG: terminase [Rhodospirillales bacterium]